MQFQSVINKTFWSTPPPLDLQQLQQQKKNPLRNKNKKTLLRRQLPIDF